MVSQQNLDKTIPEKSNHSSSNSNLSPRLSFSIPVPTNSKDDEDEGYNSTERAPNSGEFEFLSGGLTKMKAADELFCEGKLLPFWQMQQSDNCKLNKISLKSENCEKGFEKTEQVDNLEESRISSSWFLDDDPSPRPPTCTVLWKELLRLRKQRASSLSSPSSSSSSSSRSSKNETSSTDGGKAMGEINKEKVGVKRVKRVMERTRTVSSIRIRPVFNLAVCTQRKNTLFYSRKGN